MANTSGSPVSVGYPLSVSAWVNPLNPGTNRAIFNVVNTSTGQRHLFYMGTGDGLLIFSHDGSSFSQGSGATGAVTPGTWAQVGIDIQGTSSRNVIYNGVAGSLDTGTRVVTGLNRVYIGGYNDGTGLVAGFYGSGLIADVGVWNATLTQDEWTSLGARVSPRLVRPQNLVAYWPLFGRVSPTEEDWIGSLPLTASVSPPSNSDHPPLIYPGSHRQTYFGVAAAANFAVYDPLIFGAAM